LILSPLCFSAKVMERRPTRSASVTNYQGVLKVMVLGNAGVGKSSLLKRYLENSFNYTGATVGVEYSSKVLHRGRSRYKVQFFDCAGHERFREFYKSEISSADGYILVYEAGETQSKDSISQWHEKIQSRAISLKHKPIMLLANKIDCMGVSQFETKVNRSDFYDDVNGSLSTTGASFRDKSLQDIDLGHLQHNINEAVDEMTEEDSEVDLECDQSGCATTATTTPTDKITSSASKLPSSANLDRDGQYLASKLGVSYCECSAKTGKNVQVSFNHFLYGLVQTRFGEEEVAPNAVDTSRRVEQEVEIIKKGKKKAMSNSLNGCIII